MAAEIPHDDVLTRRLAEAPMSTLQIVAVAISVALNALDGFDVLAITFAAPAIAKEWTVGPGVLGVAISSGLIGMAAGSLVLAPLADRFGRRPLSLLCLALMAVGMLLTATASDVLTLCVWRVITGLGIGGLVATINAIAAEFSNERRRDLSISVMTIGYPVGGLIGGLLAAMLIELHGWRSIFVYGGLITGVFIPVVWLALPESLHFLAKRGTPEALDRINALLARMRHAPIDALPPPPAEPGRPSAGVALLLSSQYRMITLLLIGGYFLHLLTFYFYSGWLPKFMADMGFPIAQAIRTSAVMNIGGIIGGVLIGWAAPRIGLKRMVLASMAGTAVLLTVFASMPADLFLMRVVAFVLGVAIFGGIVGLYAFLARGFPTEIRVTGTGLAVGIGRAGGILGPILGGAVLELGFGISSAMVIVGASSLLAAFMLSPLKLGAPMKAATTEVAEHGGAP